MAFEFYKSQIKPNSPDMIWKPTTTSETFKVGETLKIASGKLTKCSGTAVPEYVSCADYVAPASNAKDIPVVEINPGQIYRVPLQAAGGSLVVGDKVTIHTDGLQVTATTTSGVAEIVKIEGTSVGDFVQVHLA